jgi:hypothetical protein
VVEIHGEGAVGRCESTCICRFLRTFDDVMLARDGSNNSAVTRVELIVHNSSASYSLQATADASAARETTCSTRPDHPPRRLFYPLLPQTHVSTSFAFSSLYPEAANPSLAPHDPPSLHVLPPKARLTPRAAPSIYWPCPSTLRSGHSAPFTHLPDTSYHLAYHSTALSAPGP